MRIARTHLETPAWGEAVARLGSTRLALALIGLLALGAVAASRDAGPAGWLLATPLALLALNLACAVATHASFRAQPALLAFHLALLAVVALAAAGRLTYLKGTLELSDGEEFAGALNQREQGPLHGDAIEGVAFTQLGFTVHYQPGMKRAQTHARIAWRDARGTLREAEVGDDTPLRLAGYRFYTTPNKGFAPEFVWQGARGGAPVRGTVHMPSFPAQLASQQQEWTPPGASQALTIRLELEAQLVDLERPWVLRAPVAHALAIDADAQRVVLRPGESHAFAAGTLHYVGLRMWMGYSVFYDWTLPWLLAAAVLAALALGAHYYGKFRREPWHGGVAAEAA